MSCTKYNKGDFVVYGTNGICKIDDVQKMTFPMEKEEHTYYVLKPKGNSASILFVPEHREELVSKMRYVLKKDEIDNILLGTSESNVKWIDDRNSRNNYFKKILSEGKPEEFLELIRCILERKAILAENGKKLSLADEAILSSAEKLVREEFSFVLGISEDGVTEYIKDKMEQNK